jgi:hypothetical protein
MISKKIKGPTTQDVILALDKHFEGFDIVKCHELGVAVNITPVDEDNYGISSTIRDSTSRIDYWVLFLMNCLSPIRERASTTYSIEIKVDRRDFTRELRNSRKQQWALMYSNRFYYCCPKGLIKQSELPPYAGLFELDNGIIVKTAEAPRRDSMPPNWSFVTSILWNFTLHSKRNNFEENNKDKL